MAKDVSLPAATDARIAGVLIQNAKRELKQKIPSYCGVAVNADHKTHLLSLLESAVRDSRGNNLHAWNEYTRNAKPYLENLRGPEFIGRTILDANTGLAAGKGLNPEMLRPANIVTQRAPQTRGVRAPVPDTASDPVKAFCALYDAFVEKYKPSQSVLAHAMNVKPARVSADYSRLRTRKSGETIPEGYEMMAQRFGRFMTSLSSSIGRSIEKTDRDNLEAALLALVEAHPISKGPAIRQ